MTYALDTNIISYLLKDNSVVYKNYDLATANGARCIIPPVAYYEIKRGLLYAKATAKADDFELLCHELGVGEMSVPVWNKAAEFYTNCRRKGQLIEDADLFIAAYCVVNGYILVTNNTRHFIGIDDLLLVNWAE